MNRIRPALMLLCALVLPIPVAAEVEIGDKAPPFELQGSDGKLYTLSQFAGKQGVVLAWFPKAFTPG